ISSALSRAMKRISAIAWTSGPGLAGSLIVGQTVALTLSYVTGKPLVPVNHLEGHIFSVVLDNPEISPPFLSLIVSGGHTDLVFVERFGRYRTLGRTRDDAAGEAFDKVARILGLKYPGGPQVQKFAAGVDPGKIRFPRPFMEETDDFSFSGLKTAVVYYVRDLLDGKIGGKARRRAQRRHLSMCEIKDICAGFQEAVVETLLYKTMRAAKRLGVHRVAVCGGVSANSRLRDLFKKRTSPGTKVFFPSPVNCTDNAAMIASAGYFLRMSAGRAKTKEFGIDPGLEIKNWY
ncbi:MAG: tRNA (adenosine(37)-N6)-threonylcarbamoyltransferase complex transferase subunit TsaD, partial [Elusimicrobia bacterium]|nr:tRNA (adenosine(37)-N6)-threonylcarbamoyltransferase complex transferase subunit TsaD [Elusimicrobiota bacterium]